ncbi:MAG: hypothetical protein SHS37scaffold296_34 [Burkholderiales phage 68_11]|jgi:hypothetical protein|nr:MAG: hypothetical protein SHS37scaffold296_34 [Burkholderiales phage 68_11]
MRTVEINDPLECDLIIAAERPMPDEAHARRCVQCHRLTWANTAACMWCGYDRLGQAMRWVVTFACFFIVLGIFTLKLGVL